MSSFTLRQPKEEDSAVQWIRSFERNYPQIGEFRIRSEASLFEAIINTDFLFHYSWFITCKKAVTPTYERPVNDIQRESNLKKVFGYLIHNKILRSDYLWKTKSLIKNQNNLLRNLVNDLSNHYNNLYKKEQLKNINFIKSAKREQSQSK